MAGISRKIEISLTTTSGETNAGSKLASAAGIQVVKTFDSDVFTGASVSAEKHNLDSLSALPGVARVWPMKTIYKPKPMEQADSFSDDATAPLWDIHGATGVDKLHAAGIFGEGVTIGIVDTGVWYPHPAVS